MQTFLPYPSFKDSVNCLDTKRKGKQRVESLQILINLLSGIKDTWINHPAAKMWKNYEYYLCEYSIECCKSWISDGYKDTLLNNFNALLHADKNYLIKSKSPFYTKIEKILRWHTKPLEKTEKPFLLRIDEFHNSHKSALLHKNYEYYKQFNWNIEPKLEYFWPV